MDYLKGDDVKRTATRVEAMFRLQFSLIQRGIFLDPVNSLASVLEKLIVKFSEGELKTVLY